MRGGEFLAQWPTNNLKAARHERAVTDSNDSGGELLRQLRQHKPEQRIAAVHSHVKLVRVVH
jgi:hypothetical protein